MKFAGYIILILSIIYLSGCGESSRKTIQQKTAAPNMATEEQPDGDIASNELPLIAAPWVDGEMMRLKITSPDGNEIGVLIYSAELVTEEGAFDKRDWRIISHNYVSSSDMQHYATVDMKPENFKPQVGHVVNLLGDFRAEYGNKKIRLEIVGTAGEIKKDIGVSGTIYDSEQLVYLIRRLPLSEGYKVSFPVFAAMMGTVADCNVAVIGKEQITVGAGTFDCYRVNLAMRSGDNKPQEHSLWISADEHRYLVRYIAGMSTIFELTEATVADKGMPLIFEDGELGCAVAVPYDWRFYKHKNESGFFVELLAPELKAKAVLCVLPAPANTVLPEIARQDIMMFAELYTNYKIRSDGIKVTNMGQLMTVQYAADFLEEADAARKHPQPKEVTEYRTYIEASEKIYLFVFRTEKDKFDGLKGEFDAIIQSFELKK